MARPPLQLGTWGKVSRQQLPSGRWVSRARYRDVDGRTRKVEAAGATGAAAERALVSAMKDRGGLGAEDIAPDTVVSVVATRWLDELRSEGRVRPQTLDQYRDVLERVVLPAVGRLRVREATVSRVDGLLRHVAATRPATARQARLVLSGTLALAVRHGALNSNPVREVGALPASKRTVRALTLDELQALRAAVRAWQEDPRQRGPRRAPDLLDVVDLMLATGARVGEVLAARWCDLDLGAEQPTLTITGTIVRVRGEGLRRQAHPKSAAGRRTVMLPAFAVETLLRVQVNAPANPWDVIFPSSTGTLRNPNNLRRQWRSARADTGFEWVTPHSFRRTVATLVSRSTTVEDAARQLGHSGVAVTTKHYVERTYAAPDLTSVLEGLGGRGPDQSAGLAVDR